MCRVFPCIPILKVFIFLKKVSRDGGSDFYHDSCPGLLQYTLLCKCFSKKLTFVLTFTFVRDKISSDAISRRCAKGVLNYLKDLEVFKKARVSEPHFNKFLG